MISVEELVVSLLLSKSISMRLSYVHSKVSEDCKYFVNRSHSYIYVPVRVVVHTTLWSPGCLDWGPLKHAASPIAQHPKVSFLRKQELGGENRRLRIICQGRPHGGTVVCTQIQELRRPSSPLYLHFAVNV